ncbi:hypothetical protein [Paenibacillus amylolyticus]
MSVSEHGAFRPDDAVTRAEALTMLNRLRRVLRCGRMCLPVTGRMERSRLHPKSSTKLADSLSLFIHGRSFN